jgi:hypothetical protein
LMFSSWNFLTPMLGTFCLLMISHINLYLMILVILYFWKLFKGAHSNGGYLFSTVFPYLVLLHLSRFSVQTYVKHNPFGTIRSVSQSNLYYNMLFEYCSDSCDPIYYTIIKLKKKVIFLLLFLAYQFKIDFSFFCWWK